MSKLLAHGEMWELSFTDEDYRDRVQGVVDWTHHGGYMSPGHLPYSFFPSFLILLVIQKGILGA